MPAADSRPTNPNNVVRRDELLTLEGWTLREYADGNFDVTQDRGLGLTRMWPTAAEAIAEARQIDEGR